MALLRALTAALVACGLAQNVVAEGFTVPRWPQQGARDQPEAMKASNLTVDLVYGVYQGVHNRTTKLNVWKGCVIARTRPHAP